MNAQAIDLGQLVQHYPTAWGDIEVETTLIARGLMDEDDAIESIEREGDKMTVVLDSGIYIVITTTGSITIAG